MKNRFVSVKVDALILADMFTQGWKSGAQNEITECIEGLPPGAKCVAVCPEPGSTQPGISLIFEHSSFDRVAEGEKIPEKTVLFRRFRSLADIKELTKLPLGPEIQTELMWEISAQEQIVEVMQKQHIHEESTRQ
ncbi:MAG TPA: hypothetical protein VGB45_06040 [Abditibacterium sp.]